MVCSRMSQSYGPDRVLVGAWTALTSAPFLISLPLVVRDRLRSDTLQMLLLSAALLILPAVFTSRFRVTFTADSFVYRRWGPTISVRYSDISRIEVANVTKIGRQAVGAFVVTTRGERYPFWPTLFPRDAVTRFFSLAGPQ
jgi:hypothetical protein